MVPEMIEYLHVYLISGVLPDYKFPGVAILSPVYHSHSVCALDAQ